MKCPRFQWRVFRISRNRFFSPIGRLRSCYMRFFLLPLFLLPLSSPLSPVLYSNNNNTIYVYTRFKDAIRPRWERKVRSASTVRVSPLRRCWSVNSILTNCYPFDTVHPKRVSLYVCPLPITRFYLKKKKYILIIIKIVRVR